MPESTEVPTITAKLVPNNQRADFLPRHFGPRAYLKAENMIYTRMRALSDDYTGGLWKFYELSNGGFYMAPDEARLHVQCSGNGFDGVLSGDAAGIAATLCMLSDLAFHLFHQGDAAGADHCSDAFHLLRDYACVHPEAISILDAID